MRDITEKRNLQKECWERNAVRNAMQSIKVFDNIKVSFIISFNLFLKVRETFLFSYRYEKCQDWFRFALCSEEGVCPDKT